jgi:serine/threonine protein kinase
MPKTDPVKLEEAKLAHALDSRGLLTREEFRQFRDGLEKIPTRDWSHEDMLNRLAGAGLLTPSQAKRLALELDALTKHHLPGYQLLERLGKGSMGTVYKARQLSMNRLVAIKILKPRLAANAEFLVRFQREAHLAAKFSSNNVVQAIDVGSAGNTHYFVMEYVDGTTLKQALQTGKIFPEHEAIDIVLQIARALDHAHRRQLIHRDIKPANIILTADGIAKLADLGMARGTTDHALAKAEKGMTIGTPYYIAPEQIRSKGDVDSRADMYSLGATFYHMVTGQAPYPYEKTEQVLRAHLTEELTPPDHINTALSAGLGEVVELMMAKKRADRYASPADLVIDLECILHGQPPKLARRAMETSTLQDLADGETMDQDDGADAPPRKKRRSKEADTVPALWFYALGVVLIFSLVINVIQALR